MNDVSKDAEEVILEMSKLLNIKDVKNLKILRGISQEIRDIPKITKVEDRVESVERVQTQIDNLMTNLTQSGEIRPEISDLLHTQAELLKSIISDYKSGKIQDILLISKKLLPAKDFSKLEKAYSGNIVALDRSIRLETEDYFNKLRDLTLGSAPTDILSVLAGLFTLVYYLVQSEKGKERNEIVLKYGLPALTGLSAMVYGNAKLLAGTKSLALSLITMFITNRLGESANILLQRYYQKQTQSENINNL